ncbi:MAG TPA: hypothetical protein VF791_03970 [Pyrinomonadaceae bacterium]
MGEYVLAALGDLFFAAKIRATATHLGIEVRFVKSLNAAIETAHSEPPTLVIMDLHSQKLDPFELAGRLKSDEQLNKVPLLGFYSHVQTALQRKAVQAGFDRVIPRSAFSKNLAEILEESKKQ